MNNNKEDNSSNLSDFIRYIITYHSNNLKCD